MAARGLAARGLAARGLATRGLAGLLGGLTVLGAGALAGELALLRPWPPAPVTSVAAAPAGAPAVPVAAASVPAELDVVLRRPLFAAGRRPTTAPGRADALPRLAGIVESPGASLAIFAPTVPDGRGAVLVPGGSVAGWRLARIAARSVWLCRDGRTLRLSPQHGGGAAPPAPSSAIDLRRIPMLATKRSDPQLAW